MAMFPTFNRLLKSMPKATVSKTLFPGAPLSPLGLVRGVAGTAERGARTAWASRKIMGGYPLAMGAGAAIGGATGFLTSDADNMNIRMREAANAAVFGGFAGLGANMMRRAAWKRVPKSWAEFKGTGKDIWGTAKGGWQGMMAKGRARAEKVWGKDLAKAPISEGWASFHYSSLGRTMRAPLRVGAFAVQHPFITAGVIGGAAAGYGAMQSTASSPSLQGRVTDVEMGTQYNQQLMATEAMREVGIAPMGVIGTPREMMGPAHGQFMNSTHGLTQGLHRGRHG